MTDEQKVKVYKKYMIKEPETDDFQVEGLLWVDFGTLVSQADKASKERSQYICFEGFEGTVSTYFITTSIEEILMYGTWGGVTFGLYINEEGSLEIWPNFDDDPSYARELRKRQDIDTFLHKLEAKTATMDDIKKYTKPINFLSKLKSPQEYFLYDWQKDWQIRWLKNRQFLFANRVFDVYNEIVKAGCGEIGRHKGLKIPRL